jgi:hypothetical protein
VIAPIVVGIVFLWILSVFGLSKKFVQMTEEKSASEEKPAPAPAKDSTVEAASS